MKEGWGRHGREELGRQVGLWPKGGEGIFLFFVKGFVMNFSGGFRWNLGRRFKEILAHVNEMYLRGIFKGGKFVRKVEKKEKGFLLLCLTKTEGDKKVHEGNSRGTVINFK